MIDLCLSGVFFQALKYAKTRLLPGLRLDFTGGAYDTPPDFLVGWGGDTPPHSLPPQRLRHLDLAPRLSGPRLVLKFVHLALQSKRLDTPDVKTISCSFV